MKKIVTAAALMLALGGCTTMKGFSEAGNQYADGHYVMGTWTTLMSLTVLPIVDVATLGGTLTPEQTASAATQIAQSRNKGTGSTVSTPSSYAPVPDYQPATKVREPVAIGVANAGGGGSYSGTVASTGGRTTGSSGNNAGSSIQSSGPKFTNIPSQTGCLKGEVTKEDSSVYWYDIRNSCPYPVNAHWCDHDGCSRADMAATIQSGGKTSAWVLKKYGRAHLGLLHGCQLKSGQYEVLYNHDTNQCYSRITS